MPRAVSWRTSCWMSPTASGSMPAKGSSSSMNQRRDHIEHGSLAGTVGAQQPDGLATARLQADPLDPHAVAIGLLDIDDGEPPWPAIRLDRPIEVCVWRRRVPVGRPPSDP